MAAPARRAAESCSRQSNAPRQRQEPSLRTAGACWLRLRLDLCPSGVRDFLRVTVVIGFALQLHVRQAEQFRVPAVDSQVTALEVLDEDQGEGVIEDGAHLRLARQ